MEMAHSSNIQEQVKKIKEEMFSTFDLYSFVSSSAYETAWLAMIPDSQESNHPMFQSCLDWVLNNQHEDGFWGELPTLDCLPATLACMVALKMRNVGSTNVEKGLKFFHANVEKILMEQRGCYPRWFAIVFPAMVDLARSRGLEILFSEPLEEVVEDIFRERQMIFEREELGNQYSYPPLISYLEALPASYVIEQKETLLHLSEDGSLFQSPSATARMFMATGNEGCRLYLESVVQKCRKGVPPMYPMDEDLIRLRMVDRLERLGLADHFLQEIEDILANVYRNYMNQESQAKGMDVIPIQIYKDSLAFQFLRMHGYHVSPWMFCWFLSHNDVRQHIEENYEYFITAMFNVYRATNLMFLEEDELEEARSFSRKLLEKAISMGSNEDNGAISPKLKKVIEHELMLPWLARLDHLEHRMGIEEDEIDAPWMGKASFYGLPCHWNHAVLQLAVENFTFKQSIYKDELGELTRWSKESGLCDMGFGREKTAYCYFAVAAATSSLPCNLDVRVLIAKSAILVTVIDDFFDEEGSLDELKILTEAVKRWDSTALSGHSKVMFDVLEDLVGDIAKKYFNRHKRNITKILHDIWYETFESWLTEAEWSRSGYSPSIDEYLETGMTSVAVHTTILPAASLLNPSLPKYMRNAQYETITKLLMLSTRLLNDLQSFQKEMKHGKSNLVLLYLKENPNEDIEGSIAYIRKILDTKKKELIEQILVNGTSDLPKPCKQLHLSCLKVFQMFFNSTNGFDSDTEMLSGINKAIYRPLEVNIQQPMLLKPPSQPQESKIGRSTTCAQLRKNSKRYSWHQTSGISWTNSKGSCGGTKFIASGFIF